MPEVQLDHGIIRYVDQGHGPAIMFLHGALANGNTWRKVLAAMPSGYRCIIPDLPLGGHTHPFGPDADLTPPGIAQILAQFLAALGLTTTMLVGNDTGGAYAQLFAAMYPEKVQKLVLCNCDALEVFPPAHFSSLQTGIALPGYLWLMAQLFRYKPFLKSTMVLGLLSHTLSKEEIHEFYVTSFIHNTHIRRDFKKVVQGWSPHYTQQAATRLAHFAQPVLLIWGADDLRLFSPELGKRLCAVFPNARFELVAGSLTYVQEDQPDRFVQLLLTA